MKQYRVVISDEALLAAREYLEHLDQVTGSKETAARWWKKAVAKVESLRTLPNRCPVAPENEFEQLTIRMQIVDRCLFLFTVDEADAVVRVLRFRHGSKLPRPG